MSRETITFLGFTHICGKTRYGAFKVKRLTSRKKTRVKLREMKEWLRKSRCRLKAGELLRQTKARLQGHLNYYAITDNSQSCRRYKDQVERLLYKWLNRRSQRRSYSWERFRDALAWVQWSRVHVTHNLDPFRKLVGSKTAPNTLLPGEFVPQSLALRACLQGRDRDPG